MGKGTVQAEGTARVKGTISGTANNLMRWTTGWDMKVLCAEKQEEEVAILGIEAFYSFTPLGNVLPHGHGSGGLL